MNARLYDPVLHTFLSPDALISDPSDPQHYNRYAYCLNNPLLYVDYTGNVIDPVTASIITAAIIGAIIGGVTYVGINLYNGTAITWGGLAKSIIVGAVSGAATAGIGHVAQSATTTIFGTVKGTIENGILLAVTKGVMHGAAQGIIQGVSGGNAEQSFITAMATSIAGDAFGAIGGKVGELTDTVVGHSLFGAVTGGVVSNMQGGNFWEGATIGLTVGLLNHAGKKVFEPMLIRGEMERKYPGLYKVLSKLQSYVKKNLEVLTSLSETSGYSKAQVLKLLTISSLTKIVKVGGTDEHGQFFRKIDPQNVHINDYLVKSLDSGGYNAITYKVGLNGTSFFAGVTVLHELVHYGRHWNGLSQLIGKYEAGQVFETNAFGSIQATAGANVNAIKNGW